MTAPTFVAVLPAIDYDLATSCLNSMCWALSRNLLLVDNSADHAIAQWAKPRPEIRWIAQAAEGVPANRGVPRSWNLGVDWMRANDDEYLIIISQSILFGASRGQDFLDDLADRRPPWIMHSQCGWKLIAISRALFSRVGLFDEVFSPGYREETDLLYRCHLAGLPSPQYNDGRFDQVTVDIESRGDALMVKSGQATIDFGANTAIWNAKWGGEKLSERFTSPYDDLSLDHKHTGPAPVREETNAEEHSS